MPLSGGFEPHLDSETVICRQVAILELYDELILWRDKGIREHNVHPGLHCAVHVQEGTGKALLILRVSPALVKEPGHSVDPVKDI